MTDNKATELQNTSIAILHAVGLDREVEAHRKWMLAVEDLLAPLPIKNLQQLRHLFFQANRGNGLKEVKI